VVDDIASRYVRLLDVCIGGARVEMVMPPEVGGQVQMRFQLRAEESPICATGTVVWRTAGFRGRGGVMGVHFMQVDGVSTIRSYVGRAG